MSDGRIVDFFDDGDRAIMTGGRIGRVNMKLDNNLFDMSGGTIDRNLVTGFGNDTIILSNGTIGGNISVSGGTDSVTVTGGSVGGNVLMSFGADTFTWDGGGIIFGAVDLGGDNDTATLRNLTNAQSRREPTGHRRARYRQSDARQRLDRRRCPVPELGERSPPRTTPN